LDDRPEYTGNQDAMDEDHRLADSGRLVLK
jgi:hypothetical protein